MRAMDLAQRLRKARKFAELTQAALAEKSGVKQQMISKLENGQSKETADLVALAVACGVRPEWLAGDDGPMVAPKHEMPSPEPGWFVVVGHGVYEEIDQEALDIAVAWRSLSRGTKRMISRQITEEIGDLNPLLRRLWDSAKADDQDRADRKLEEAQEKIRSADNGGLDKAARKK